MITGSPVAGEVVAGSAWFVVLQTTPPAYVTITLDAPTVTLLLDKPTLTIVTAKPDLGMELIATETETD